MPVDQKFPPLAVLTVASVEGRTLTVSTDGADPGFTGPPDHPLAAEFESWELSWGDGTVSRGTGAPPKTLTHVYALGVVDPQLHLIVVSDNTLRDVVEVTAALRDAAPRVLAITALNGNPSDQPLVSWGVTFDMPVQGVTLEAFQLVAVDVIGATLASLAPDPANAAHYTVTANTGKGARRTKTSGTLRLDLERPFGIESVGGEQPLLMRFEGDTYTIEDVAIPPIDPVPPTTRTLLGGWRIAQEFARGTIAIDFDTMTLYMAGHEQGDNILRYQLPAMGTGSDINLWPRVDPVENLGVWWPYDEGSYTFANGLAFFRGKLWVAPCVFYAASPVQATNPLILHAPDGDTIHTALPRQQFSGFVKRGPGLDPYIGGGAYHSGQGSVSGPTLATIDGAVKITWAWPAMPGPNYEYYNHRCPRDPNAYPIGWTEGSVPVGAGDSWVVWEPRNFNDGNGLVHRWCSDNLLGGGLVLPSGITYWPLMGIGELDYTTQAPCFAQPGMLAVYEYRFSPTTFQLTEFGHWPVAQVTGQELGPDGRLYIAHKWLWASGMYPTDIVVSVYEEGGVPAATGPLDPSTYERPAWARAASTLYVRPTR